MNIVELEEKLKTKGIKNITGRSISGIWGMNEQSYSRKRKEGSDIKEKIFGSLNKNLIFLCLTILQKLKE